MGGTVLHHSGIHNYIRTDSKPSTPLLILCLFTVEAMEPATSSYHCLDLPTMTHYTLELENNWFKETQVSRIEKIQHSAETLKN